MCDFVVRSISAFVELSCCVEPACETLIFSERSLNAFFNFYDFVVSWIGIETADFIDVDCLFSFERIFRIFVTSDKPYALFGRIVVRLVSPPSFVEIPSVVQAVKMITVVNNANRIRNVFIDFSL